MHARTRAHTRMYIYMALQSFCWALAAFSIFNLIHSRYDSDGGPARCKAVTYTQNKRTQTSIPRIHDTSVRAATVIGCVYIHKSRSTTNLRITETEHNFRLRRRVGMSNVKVLVFA
jgi:hypothetical protein